MRECIRRAVLVAEAEIGLSGRRVVPWAPSGLSLVVENTEEFPRPRLRAVGIHLHSGPLRARHQGNQVRAMPWRIEVEHLAVRPYRRAEILVALLSGFDRIHEPLFQRAPE